MPQIIVPLIIAGATTAITMRAQKKAQKKAIASQERKAARELETEEMLAEKQLALQKTEQEASRATGEKLTEKQIMLESQRRQIDTLFNILQTQRMAGQVEVAPQYFPAPQPVRGALSFIENINSVIDKLFRG